MNKEHPLDCLLIGSGNLLIKCAEILISNNCHIVGIISPDRGVACWAEKQSIPWFKNPQQFKKLVAQPCCDYLFSIVNQSILKQEILELAPIAINYHDALLPAYAGLNATSWAIIHGEHSHGITWHEMSLKVDSGKILKQVKIDLDEAETALTLNLKCYQAAVVSFQELIAELIAKKTIVKEQDLRQRSYFARHQKPPSLGIIDFHWPARVIDNLVRGLDFGNYPNPLTTVKLALNSSSAPDGLDYVLVTKVKVLPTLSSRPPGTIVALEAEQLIVATGSQDIALTNIIDREKQPQAIAELVARYQLAIGQKLPEVNPQAIAELVRFAREVAPSETYWIKQLAQLRPLNLPFSQIPAIASSQRNDNIYQQVKLSLNPNIINLLQESLEIPLAAWAIYLAKLSGNKRMSLGFDRLNKDPWFARYIPCNLKIDLEQDFTTIVKTVGKRLELNHKHQTYATDLIVRHPQLAGNLTDFTAIVSQVDRDFPSSEALAPSQITLIIDQAQGEYFWSYNNQIFSAQAIETMIEQWTVLLGGIADNIDHPVSQIPLISAAERQKILREWNDTKMDYPANFCLHQLFETQAGKQAQAKAVVYQGEYLTYGELEQKANQLAHYLQELGVRAETLVGVCLDPSIERIVGLFAILKAGGAYLPLDPNYPSARLEYLLIDAGVEILLTQSKLLECLPETNAKILCLDQDWPMHLKTAMLDSLDRNNISQVKSNTHSHNLAYAIYTSGSTGNPKGVEIEHHSVVNTLWDIEERFGVNSQDRILAVSSLSFDLSVYDIFGVLGSGGTVIIPQAENHPNPEHWLELMLQEKVTIWNSAPPLMELLLDYIATKKEKFPPSLRLVLLSGDRISPNLVLQLQTLNPQLQIISLGGATEASIWSIYYPIYKLSPSATGIPYGRPLNNQSFYILDQALQLVPTGVIGELYIGGIGVARGYLHREELTAAKFIADPFSNSATARIYKTGDLGRYLEDGNIEFLGRIDNQVKIRGVRVELGEIEATLLQYPGIKEAIVALVKLPIGKAVNRPSGENLVAYCVIKSPSITSRQLRDFLQTKLPKYAIPVAFVFLNSLPLTPNGKVNRQALLEMPVEQITTATKCDFLPPQDRLEWQLSQIWSRVLNIKPIGRNDNFFELGGTSLLALHLFEEIQHTFQQKIPLAILFQAPTIAQLATLMLERGWSASWSSLVSIQPRGNQPPLFCIHAVGGNVLAYRLLAKELGTERPVYGLQAKGLDGKQPPLTSVEEMAASYLEEIKLIQPQGPYFLAGHSFGGFVAFEIAQQLFRQGEKVAFLALLDCFGPNGNDKSTFIQRLLIHLTNLNELSPKEKLDYFIERLEYAWQLKSPKSWQKRYLQLTCLMLSPEKKLISQITQINFQAKHEYIPTVYEGKLTILRARVRNTFGYYDPDAGWHGMALGGIEVDEVPGTHISMLLKLENCQVLATKLKAILRRFTEQTPSPESAKIKQIIQADNHQRDSYLTKSYNSTSKVKSGTGKKNHKI